MMTRPCYDIPFFVHTHGKLLVNFSFVVSKQIIADELPLFCSWHMLMLTKSPLLRRCFMILLKVTQKVNSYLCRIIRIPSPIGIIPSPTKVPAFYSLCTWQKWGFHPRWVFHLILKNTGFSLDYKDQFFLDQLNSWCLFIPYTRAYNSSLGVF